MSEENKELLSEIIADLVEEGMGSHVPHLNENLKRWIGFLSDADLAEKMKEIAFGVQCLAWNERRRAP